MSEVKSAEDESRALMERFQESYRVLREAWLKTGGGMEMELKIRDIGAEAEFQRRSAAAKKGAAKRSKYG